MPSIAEGIVAHAQQYRLRTGFDEYVVAGEHFHAGTEAHGLAHVAAPIGGVRHLGRHRLAADVRDQFELRRRQNGSPRTTRSNSSSIGLHQRRMEGVRNRQSPAADAGACKRRLDRRDGLLLAGYDHFARPVDAGERDAISAKASRYGATRSSAARTAAIAPLRGSACIRRPRAAISLQSVFETEHAAPGRPRRIRPTLWPSTVSGRTPQLSHSSASAYSRANSAGCV